MLEFAHNICLRFLRTQNAFRLCENVLRRSGTRYLCVHHFISLPHIAA